MRVEWFPPASDMVPFETGRTAAVRLLSLDGITAGAIAPVTIKAPGQSGETMVDAAVSPRVVTIQALLQAPSNEALWTLRAAIARAMVVTPVRLNGRLSLGRLRVLRDGQDPLELEALPRSVGLPAPRSGVGVIPMDVEFLCPSPFWRETADQALSFTAAGGWEWPIEIDDGDGFEMLTNNIEQEVLNEGDVDTPIVARLHGDCTGARLLNLTTGETFEITGQIEDGEYVEVSTAFGDKRIELVDGTGARTSVMDRLDLSASSLWSLRPGLNVVRFEADVNTSGRADIAWRQRYGGI